MTTYTAAQLATRVLKHLGLVGAEETPSAVDQAWALEITEAEIGRLNAKGINIWNGSQVSVPHEYMVLLSHRIGLAMAPSFGLSDAATAQLAMEAAERDLRTLGMVTPTGAVLEAEHF